MQGIEARRETETLGIKVRDGTDAGRAVGQLLGIGLAVGNEIFQFFIFSRCHHHGIG